MIHLFQVANTTPYDIQSSKQTVVYEPIAYIIFRKVPLCLPIDIQSSEQTLPRHMRKAGTAQSQQITTLAKLPTHSKP